MANWLLLAALFVLGGCAEWAQQMQEAREREAHEMQEKMQGEVAAEPSDNLCVVSLIKPKYRQLAESELATRQYHCDWPQAQARAQIWLAQKQAYDTASMNAVVGYINSMNAQTNALNASAAAQAQSNQTFNCYSKQQGVGISTSCR